MSSQKFSVVKATDHKDITFAVECGRNEELWSIANHDDEIFFTLAPCRCYYGKLGDEQVSYVQIASYGEKEEYCYVGMYIVKKKYRHKGYGKQTWDRAWAELPDSSLVSLSAIVPNDQLYMKYGFTTKWKEHSYLFDAKKIVELFDSNEEDVAIIHYKDADFQSLLQYDTNAFCYSREAYLRKVTEVSNSEGWVATNQDNKIVGYVVARYSLDISGWRLLPLIADTLSIAKALLVELSKFLIDRPVTLFHMTVPGPNTCAVTFGEQFGEKKISETMRMFARGNPPDQMVKNHAEIIFSMSPDLG